MDSVRQGADATSGTVPPVNGRRSQSRYDRHERRADHGCPKRGRASHRCAHPRGPHRAAARLRGGDDVPRPPVPRPRHRDRVQRRAALREALAGDRGRTRTLDPRRAHLLPRPALVAGAGTRLAARLDAERLRRRQDHQRRRDVGRGLSRVLARAPARSAVVRDPDRDRSGDDTGARLPRLPHVRGARVSGLPRHRRRAPARGHEAVTRNGDRRTARLPARRRDQSPVPRLPLAYLAAVAICGRGDYRRHLGARRTHGRVRRTGRRRPGRARTIRRGNDISATHRRVAHWALVERITPPVLGRPRDRDGRSCSASASC